MALHGQQSEDNHSVLDSCQEPGIQYTYLHGYFNGPLGSGGGLIPKGLAQSNSMITKWPAQRGPFSLQGSPWQQGEGKSGARVNRWECEWGG